MFTDSNAAEIAAHHDRMSVPDIVERARSFLGREKRASSLPEACDCSIACSLLRESVNEVERLRGRVAMPGHANEPRQPHP